MVIIVDPSGFDLVTCILQRFKLVTVQVFVQKTPVKTLNMRIFNGFSWSNEIQPHVVLKRSGIQPAGQSAPSADKFSQDKRPYLSALEPKAGSLTEKFKDAVGFWTHRIR